MSPLFFNFLCIIMFISLRKGGQHLLNKSNIKNLTLTSMFIAIGIILPFFTGQIPKIGAMMLPMHLPIMLCGLILGWKWGAASGIITPLLRSCIFHFPVLYPNAVCMAFELMTYGAVVGFFYNKSKWQCLKSLLRSIVASMILGRIVWAVSETFFLGLMGTKFTLEMFFASSITNAIPGIIIQLVFIPAIMISLDKTGVVKFHKEQSPKSKMERC